MVLLDDVLGAGTFAKVYKATDRATNKEVSLIQCYLVFTKQQCGEPVFCPRFNPRLTPAIAEANALAHSEQTNNCGGSVQRLKESLETIEKAQVLRAKNLLMH